MFCHVHRTAYYTAYRQVYRQDHQTVNKCCPGWSQLNGEAGCLYRKYPVMFIFSGFLVKRKDAEHGEEKNTFP